MDALQILLLGPPDVLWNGAPVRIPRRSLRAMLFYLAANGQISRSELYNHFWPAESEQKAQANLRTALTRLRNALPDPKLVVVSLDHVALDRQRVIVDVIQFKNLVEQTWQVAAQLPATVLLPEWVVRLMRQAVQLWRSSHFMAGFTFPEGSLDLDHWQSITSQRLENDYQRMLIRLADHFSLLGDLDSAQRTLLTALEVDPFDSELNARVLRILLSQNRAGAASAFAESLQARYAQEKEDLTGELLEYCQRAQRGEESAAAVLEDWPAWQPAQVRLVNRRAEIDQLQKAFWRGGTAVLWGDAGSGKTRLAYEFYRTLSPAPRLVLLSAFQIETSLPFQAMIDALRRSVSQAEWQRLANPWRRQLSYLLPELAGTAQPYDLPAQIPGEILRGNLYEALRQLLMEISGSRKILMVLDQAQWADESTLTALAYLVDRGFFAEHGMLLLAARSEEPTPALDRFIQQSRAQKSILHVRLGPLSQPDVAELAHLVLGRPLEESQVNRLALETGGIPLFILETLRALIENTPEVDLQTAFDTLPVGGSLYVLLQERLNRLAPAARQVAAAAAVIGDEAGLELIAAVAQMEPETVALAVDELARAKIIQVRPAGRQVTYSFVNRQMIEVIQWVLGPARLRLLHLRAARALESLYMDPNPLAASLAQHYEAAGEILVAIQYWLKAGRYALSLISIHEAELAFRAADRLARRSLDALPDRLLLELYIEWGNIALEQADTLVLQQIYSRLQHIGEDRHSGLLLGSAFRGFGDLHSLLGEPERALDFFHQAEFYLEPLGEPLELARLYNRMGIFFTTQLRYDEAADLLERAISAAGGLKSEDPLDVRAALECSLGMVYNLTGWPDKAQQVVERSLWSARSPAVMYGHLVMSTAKLHTGERLASLEHARLGLQVAQSIPSPRMVVVFMGLQARSALSMGQVDDAWETLQAALAYAQSNRLIDQLTLLQTGIGDLHRNLGDLSAALKAYRLGLAANAGKEELWNCQVQLAQTLANLGDSENALSLVEEVYRQSRKVNMGSAYIPAMASWTLMLAQSGQLERSVGVMEEWLQAIQGRNYRSYSLVEKVVLCQRAIQRGDLPEAHLQANRAVLMGKTFGSPWWELMGFNLLRLLGPLDAQAVIQVEGILNRILQNCQHPDLQTAVHQFVLTRRNSLLSA